MATSEERAEIREFLSSRRARLTPQQVGLPAYGGSRRVKGLCREEVAMLAGVSVDYYVRMERGNLSGASDSVLDALVSALHLDDAERDHLFALARASGTSTTRRKQTASSVVNPGRSAGAGRDHRRARLGSQRSARHRRDQPARSSAVRACAGRSRPTGEHRSVRLPRSGGRTVLRRL